MLADKELLQSTSERPGRASGTPGALEESLGMNGATIDNEPADRTHQEARPGDTMALSRELGESW